MIILGKGDVLKIMKRCLCQFTLKKYLCIKKPKKFFIHRKMFFNIVSGILYPGTY